MRPSAASLSEEPASKRVKPSSSVLCASLYGEASLLNPEDHGWDGGETVSGARTGWNCLMTSSQVVLDSA
eukprot:5090122-Amphidinium_carterae.1